MVGKLPDGITELGQLGGARALCLPPDLPGFQKRKFWEEKFKKFKKKKIKNPYLVSLEIVQMNFCKDHILLQ